MPEINQYQFKYGEVLEALVKHAGLHEGKWQLIMNFGMAATNMGPTPEQVVPAAAVGVQWIGLTRATETSPSSLVIDASDVNPASTVKRQPS
jgi:hypothetical protein